MGWKHWTKEELFVVEKVWINFKKKEILKALPKRTWGAVKRQAVKLKIKRDILNPNVKKLNIRLNNLLKETPETYYWIGFLMADGTIDHQRYKIAGNFSIKDKNHIKKLCKYIGCKINIKNPSKTGYKTKNMKICCFQTQNFIIVKNIIKKFNFKQKKTYNPPESLNIINDDLFTSFIIGYIDGDGYICKDNNRIQITCHKSWNKCLNKWFLRMWKISNCKIINDRHKIPKVRMVRNYTKNKTNGFARIDTNNKTFVIFLRNKAVKLNLPYLRRKWNNIFY